VKKTKKFETGFTEFILLCGVIIISSSLIFRLKMPLKNNSTNIFNKQSGGVVEPTPYPYQLKSDPKCPTSYNLYTDDKFSVCIPINLKYEDHFYSTNGDWNSVNFNDSESKTSISFGVNTHGKEFHFSCVTETKISLSGKEGIRYAIRIGSEPNMPLKCGELNSYYSFVPGSGLFVDYHSNKLNLSVLRQVEQSFQFLEP
jgi:hypothetical protein